MRRNFNDLRMSYVNYQLITKLLRTCIDRIVCTKCVRFEAQRAFCDEHYCDIVDRNNRTLYEDTNHIGIYGMVRLRKFYLQLFHNLTKIYIR